MDGDFYMMYKRLHGISRIASSEDTIKTEVLGPNGHVARDSEHLILCDSSHHFDCRQNIYFFHDNFIF